MEWQQEDYRRIKMPKSELDWTLTFILFGYFFGYMAMIPMILMRALQKLQDEGYIPGVTKYFFASLNLLVVLAALIYVVSFLFGVARKYNQDTTLNSALSVAFTVISLLIGIYVYAQYDKAVQRR
jgi:dolichyl-phosphate-mannose--protein O-mannosyl transferase